MDFVGQKVIDAYAGSERSNEQAIGAPKLVWDRARTTGKVLCHSNLQKVLTSVFSFDVR